MKQRTAITRTNHAGNYVYENDALQFFSQPEGYVEPNGSSWQYVYRYTDIWGNTRITYADDNNDGVITASSEIRREQNFYPFGLEHKGYNNVITGVKNNLKTYQGQEFTDDLQLNIHEWRYRISDPAIGRFWQIDPLADEYTYNSTYAFQENKLGLGVELEGLEVKLVRSGLEKMQSGTTRQISESMNINRSKEISSGNSNAVNTRNVEINGAKNQIMEGATEAGVGSIDLAGSGMQNLGSAMEILGTATLIPSVGTSSTLIGFGKLVSGIGTGFKMAANYIKGDTSANIEEGVNAIVGTVTGGLADEAMSATKKVSDLTKNNELIQETILQSTGFMWNYTSEIIINKTINKESQETNKNKKENE